MILAKNHCQPISNKLADNRRQPVARFLQRVDDSSGEETAALRCDLRLDGFCFDDPEEEDNAEGEQNKERKGDDVVQGEREEEEQAQEEKDETIFERIPEECKDSRQIKLDILQPFFDDLAERDTVIFLHNFQSFRQKKLKHPLVEPDLSSLRTPFSNRFLWDPASQVAYATKSHMSPHSNSLVRA
jgi:hypothetical protein